MSAFWGLGLAFCEGAIIFEDAGVCLGSRMVFSGVG